MAEAEFTRDVGSGDQLDAGGATDLNQTLQEGEMAEEVIAQAGPQIDQMAEEMALPPIEYADDDEPVGQPGDGMESVLFGPSEGLGKGMPLPTEMNHPARRAAVRALPQMSLIIRDPSTPPAVKAAYKYLVQLLEREEQQQNGIR